MKSILGGKPSDLLNNSLFYSFKDNILYFLAFLVFVLVFKAMATAITTGAGGIGGIFAPAHFMGGITGFVFSRGVNSFNFVQLSESNFALVGMAGLIAGVIHAPLTAIFLIAEITNGYGLFIPLMVTSAISYLTILYFEPHSIYTKKLAKRGELLTHNKDKAVLSQMRVADVMENDATTIGGEASLGDLVQLIAKSKRNIIPVLDKNKMLLGIIALDNIRHLMFNQEMYATTKVSSLMVLPPTYITSRESMSEVVIKFEDSGEWSLPVVDEGEYKGFILKTKVFSAYRKKLLEFSED